MSDTYRLRGGAVNATTKRLRRRMATTGFVVYDLRTRRFAGQPFRLIQLFNGNVRQTGVRLQWDAVPFYVRDVFPDRASAEKAISEYRSRYGDCAIVADLSRLYADYLHDAEACQA